MDIQELIVRHRADAWDCHSRGKTELSQLHMVFARELELLAGRRWSNGLPVIKVKAKP